MAMIERSIQIGQVYPDVPRVSIQRLEQDTRADVVIVGGGITGLSAAQAFSDRGASVVLVERDYCGAGATGKSSGFITPDSEFHLRSFADRFGVEKAKQLWEFATGGVELIKSNIESFGIECDYQTQDTLVVATSMSDYHSQIESEHEIRQRLGYESTLYSQAKLPSILGTEQYFGGVRYPQTFGINGFYYAQGMKDVISKKGVRVFEETPALALEPHRVTTPQGFIDAELVVLATDRFIPEMHKLTYDIYNIQTFLMTTEPLSDNEMRKIFPEKPFMVWDTQLLYTYFRMTYHNRLMMGGSSLVSSYAGREWPHSQLALRKTLKYFRAKFPSVVFKVEHSWPGLLGISKDFLPVAGKDKNDSSLYCAGAAAGLPWSAALGRYCVEAMLDQRSDMDEFFSPSRRFRLGHTTQNIIGTRATFALSHLINSPNK